jgi:uncharacterized protein
MLAWALPAGLAIGMSLGALGGGGSILTVPALVYLLHQNAHAATTASLIIVGFTALAGAAGHWRAGRVRATQGTVFGLLGVAGSYAGSRASALVSQHVLVAAFALLMLIAAAAMLRRRTAPRDSPEDAVTAAPRWKSYAKVIAAATGVGLLTGFFGVGGGFVIVPALVLALGFDMPVAVGTSLLVIAITSAVAFAVRADGGGLHLDWTIVALFAAAAVVGTLAGKRVADRVSGRGLTIAFAILLVALAGYMLSQSVPALI